MDISEQVRKTIDTRFRRQYARRKWPLAMDAYVRYLVHSPNARDGWMDGLTEMGRDTVRNLVRMGYCAFLFRNMADEIRAENLPPPHVIRSLPSTYFYIAGRALMQDEENPLWVYSLLADCVNGRSHNWLAAQLSKEPQNETEALDRVALLLERLFGMSESMKLPRELADKIRSLAKEIDDYRKGK